MTDVVATINGQPVSLFEFHNALQGYAMQLYRKTMDHLSEEEFKEVEQLAREKIVARELIFQDAMQRGLRAAPADVEAEIAKTAANFADISEMYATLARAGITKEIYHRIIEADLTVNRATAEHMDRVDDPTEEEVRALYEENRDKMKTPAQVRASHILLRTEGADKEEVRARIDKLRAEADEDNFAKLAMAHSDCPSGKTGGDLGFFKRGDMVKPFEEAAFSQAVGAVSPAVETQFGFHLIMVTGKREAKEMSLDQASLQIRTYLQNEARARAIGEWVDDLKKDARIELKV